MRTTQPQPAILSQSPAGNRHPRQATRKSHIVNTALPLPAKSGHKMQIPFIDHEDLKEFLKLAAAPSVQLKITDPGLLLDLDTPEDYILVLPSQSVA